MTHRVRHFRSLHTGTDILRLPNAWDAGSAILFESLGAAAIATTSAGVALALGYPDGYKMPTGVVLTFAKNLRRVITVPLSVDIENGYSNDPHEVADFVLRLIDAGIDGINIEDGTDAPSVLAKKIEAIRNVVSRKDLDIFVNARVDVILAGLVEASKATAEIIARGATYAAAGADGLFVPALTDKAQIQAIVTGVKLPINVLAWAGLPDATELSRLGVHRLSAGSSIAQMLWSQAETMATDFLLEGRSQPFDNGQMGYARLQALFANSK